MLAAARTVGGSVAAAVVGSAELARSVASDGFDSVLLFEAAEGVPVESLAGIVAARVAVDAPKLVVTGDVASSRALAGAIAGALDAAVIGSVIKLDADDDAIILTSEIANAKSIEDVKVNGPVVAIYTGADADVAVDATAPIESVATEGAGDMVVGTAEPTGAGLASAQRVVAVGMGLASRENLAITDALAEKLGAYIACSLPSSEDMHWYEPDRVVGSSHNSTSPELYIAVGISGSPNHTSGFKDAKVVCAINNDPNAEIFSCAKFGIVGDLFKVVPALTAAL